VQIYDDGDEATIVIENVTHHHTNPYDAEMTPRQRDGHLHDRRGNPPEIPSATCGK
jgi:hypothetical protein